MHRTAIALQLGSLIVAFAVPAAGGVPVAAPLHFTHTYAQKIPAPSKATVFVGTVRDAATGKPVPGVLVRVEQSTFAGTTNDQGTYTFVATGLASGTSVMMTARRIGYQSESRIARVRSDTVRMDFSITASTQTLNAVTVQAPVAPLVERGQVGSQAVITAEQLQSFPTARNARGDVRQRNATGGSIGNRDQYDRIEDNPFLAVKGNPRSTFSIDVDRASYGNVRRMITAGRVPPPDAVRIEELINYFPYTLAGPSGNAPVAITTEVAPAPWQPKHRLVRVALKAREIEMSKLPPNNLVFLIDVSGSMQSPDKLPLVKQSLRLLVDQLREEDRVAIVVYAGAAGLVLPSTSGVDKARITAAIDALEAGGSTAGGAGIRLAYSVAKENFIHEGNNRVVLATDGDFNVGASSDGEMERLIEQKRAEGTYLTVLGFGTGNYQDAKMEKLAKKGNGNYAYIDRIAEARKALVHEMGATLLTVANDVKLQVEFNPASVQAYRLIGYENRLLRDEDFSDDRKDAGDIGAGHTVTAFYEVVPVGVTGTTKVMESDGLRYTATPAQRTTSTSRNGELAYVKLRYKQPGDSASQLMTHVVNAGNTRTTASEDFRFAASVAAFGMVLRDSEHKGNANAAAVMELAREALGRDAGGYRAEFVALVERWQNIRKVAQAEDRSRR